MSVNNSGTKDAAALKNLISFDDGLRISYGVYDCNDDGEIYHVLLYFEKTPVKKRDKNKTAEYIYPGDEFKRVVNFNKKELKELRIHVGKLGPLALEFAQKDGIHKCPYCGRYYTGYGGNPEDYGLHSFVDWKTVPDVCGECDLVVVQTDRLLKRVVDERMSDDALKMLESHIKDIRRYYKKIGVTAKSD